jgi:hypothetical protein
MEVTVVLEAKMGKFWVVRLIGLGLMTFGLGALHLYLESRSYVRLLDEDGVTVRSGKRYAWKDLKKVKARYRGYPGRASLAYVYLEFTNGTAGVFWQMFENGVYVLDFVQRMTKQPIPLRN